MPRLCGLKAALKTEKIQYTEPNTVIIYNEYILNQCNFNQKSKIHCTYKNVIVLIKNVHFIYKFVYWIYKISWISPLMKKIITVQFYIISKYYKLFCPKKFWSTPDSVRLEIDFQNQLLQRKSERCNCTEPIFKLTT